MTRGIQIPTIPQPRTNPKIADSGRRTRYMPLRDVIKGNRVSPAPRRAPSIAKKTPTAGMLTAWIRMNVTLQETTTGSPMKARAMNSAKRKIPMAITLITTTENFIASQPLFSASSGFRAPRFWPTRAVAAIANPNPGMNAKLWIRRPIWCAARICVPKTTTMPTHNRNATCRRICSSAAGQPIRKIRRTASMCTHTPVRWSINRCVPRSRTAIRAIAPMTDVIRLREVVRADGPGDEGDRPGGHADHDAEEQEDELPAEAYRRDGRGGLGPEGPDHDHVDRRGQRLE